MKIQFPFLSTSIETDILGVLLLTPLWMVLGFNIFIYQGITLLVLMKWMILSRSYGESLSIPRPLVWFGFYLLAYWCSLLINFGNLSLQRILASINSYLIYIMGFFLALVSYHSASWGFLLRFLRVGRHLCLVTGILTLFCLGLWYAGYKNLYFDTLVGKVLPGLMRFPYFYSQLQMTLTRTDILSISVPRIDIYNGSTTDTGGFMLLIIPLLMAFYGLQPKKKWEYCLLFVISFVPLLASMSRSALCTFIGSLVLVNFIERRKDIYYSVFGFIAVLLASNFILRSLFWLSKIREISTNARLQLYAKALREVIEKNPLIGVGVKLRDGFTMTAIGSHSTYVGIVLVTGFVGFTFYMLFQFFILRTWYAQRNHLRNHDELVIWKYLGMAFIATSVFLSTENLDNLPYYAYGYFVLVACILFFSALLTEKPVDLSQIR
ncbi:MAG: O-antigen ligase family protein [Candidatus Omnitrophica bacterium]|nr:O-antigen ligase family protein [Candidatus Omnitrophota bacterium]